MVTSYDRETGVNRQVVPSFVGNELDKLLLLLLLLLLLFQKGHMEEIKRNDTICSS
jgi:hypothetical protein